jgi:hypothetical protein
MKKGLILALLVVAMVALVLPVSARAPIIKSLPTIIIGDADDDASGKGILRFPSALNLKDTKVVDWNNDESYTSDTFHAYLFQVTDPSTATVKAYNATRVIEPLDATEYANLLAAGAMPAADTRITSYTSPSNQNWLVNLFDAGRHPRITSPATADPATQGELLDAYSEEVAMKLVCGVTSGTTLVVNKPEDGNLVVKCQSGQNDSKSSPFTEVVSYSFSGSNDGWTFATLAGFDAATPTTAGPGSTGIGFVVSAPITLTGPCMYSLWTSPANLPSSNADGGKVYRATATLESTSTSPATALGYRLRYFCTGFAHQGFMIVKSTPSVANDAVNVPYAGHPFTAKLFWAPRPDLGDMGDGEGQTMVLLGEVLRNYKLAWEIIGLTGQQGTLTMESIYVDSFAKPAATTKVVAWGSGSGEIPFNAADTAGGMQTRNSVPSFTDGSIAAAAANAVVTLTGTEKTKRYVGIKPNFVAPLINVKPVANHLYRFSATLACASRTAIPTYRVVVNSQIVPPLPAVQLGAGRDIGWIDWFSFSDAAGAGGKQTGYMLPGQTVAPFAPATGGSAIDVYIYSHSIAPTTVGTSIFVPILDSVDCGVYGNLTVWPDPVTAMTWSAAGWEDLGADY